MNHIYYFLAVLYLIVLVFIAGVVHARQVERRKREASVADQAAFVAAVAPAADSAGGKGGLGHPQQVNAAAGAAAAGTASYGPPVERIPSLDTADAGYYYGNHPGFAHSDQMVPPSGPSPFEGVPGGNHQGYPAGGMHAAGGVGVGGARGPSDTPWPTEGVPGGNAATKATPAQPAAGAASAAAAGGKSEVKGSQTWLKSLFSADMAREPAPTLFAPTSAAGAAATTTPPKPYNQRFWVSSIFKLLITHLQMLGLMRGLRVNWPEGVNAALVFFDQTSTVSSWVSLDCSLGNSEHGGLRRSIKRTLALLLLPGECSLVGWCQQRVLVRGFASGMVTHPAGGERSLHFPASDAHPPQTHRSRRRRAGSDLLGGLHTRHQAPVAPAPRPAAQDLARLLPAARGADGGACHVLPVPSGALAAFSLVWLAWLGVALLRLAAVFVGGSGQERLTLNNALSKQHTFKKNTLNPTFNPIFNPSPTPTHPPLTQVSNAVISIFSCTPLDSDTLAWVGTKTMEVVGVVGPKGALVASAPTGYWNEDTAYVCYKGHHAWLAGLGALWMALFCVGFPVGMAVTLWGVRGRLEEKEVSG